MQLFITPVVCKDGYCDIYDTSVLHQITKVLRYSPGKQFAVQDESYRYIVTLEYINKDHAYARIDQTITLSSSHRRLVVALAVPNKRDKAELIIQKLSELGVDRIIRRQAQRSQLHIDMIGTNKLTRRYTIAREAVEQSWGVHVPHIQISRNIQGSLLGSHCFVADMQVGAKPIQQYHHLLTDGLISSIIIGPEGGLTPQDYIQFPDHHILSLGETVLRMETAAICATWGLLQM